VGIPRGLESIRAVAGVTRVSARTPLGKEGERPFVVSKHVVRPAQVDQYPDDVEIPLSREAGSSALFNQSAASS
jgi:hypothetical protein